MTESLFVPWLLRLIGLAVLALVAHSIISERKTRVRLIPVHTDSFTEHGTVQGQVIMVGGKHDRVSVHIQEGNQVWLCHASRERAREMAQYIFGPAIRVSGSARWEQDRNGRWHQNDFTIKDFELLNDEPLPDVVKKLQSVAADWKTPDALQRLEDIRSGEADET